MILRRICVKFFPCTTKAYFVFLQNGNWYFIRFPVKYISWSGRAATCSNRLQRRKYETRSAYVIMTLSFQQVDIGGAAFGVCRAVKVVMAIRTLYDITLIKREYRVVRDVFNFYLVHLQLFYAHWRRATVK